MQRLKIKIIGSGPTGCLLAISLASIGIYVDLYDTTSLKKLSQNTRTYAITHSTRKLFERIGIWTSLNEILSPFDSLHVEDMTTRKKILFQTKT